MRKMGIRKQSEKIYIQTEKEIKLFPKENIRILFFPVYKDITITGIYTYSNSTMKIKLKSDSIEESFITIPPKTKYDIPFKLNANEWLSVFVENNQMKNICDKIYVIITYYD
jgi:hypothetical protein